MQRPSTQRTREERAQTQFAREMWVAASEARRALESARNEKQRAYAVESALEALAFLTEQAKSVLRSKNVSTEIEEPYIEHVASLHEDLDWIVPVVEPVVYVDKEEGGAFVEALIWVANDDLEDFEDEDSAEEDPDDEDEEDDEDPFDLDFGDEDDTEG